jgi:glycosyltransferase involved in cell wall biosynthesis
LAFVSHKFECNDGQGRVNYEVVKAALEYGYRVTVLAARCAVEISEHPLARYVQIGNENLPTALLRELVFARSSATWLRNHRAELDLVQVNGFVTWAECDIAAAHFVHSSWKKNQYYPFVTSSPYALYQRLYTVLNSRWEKRVFTTAKTVIAVSSTVGDELQELGVRPERIAVIFNGVDTDQFSPGPADRNVFGLPVYAPLGLFVGDIRTPRKNLETVLRAMMPIPDLHLAVAGAAEGSKYPGMAQRLGIANRVHFLGKIRDMPTLMRSVDIVVYPSRYDPFGLVVLEAMSSGIPVIASAPTGIADHIGDAGEILRNPDDVVGLSSLLTKCLSDPATRAVMGKSGRQRALEMRWSDMTAKYLDVYDKMIHVAH